MSRYAKWSALVLVAIAGACADDHSFAIPTRPDATGATPAFARAPDTQSRANLLWADSVNIAVSGGAPSWRPAGIRGDGRDRYGKSATFSEYQGNVCGVYGQFGSTADASLNVDPDFGYTTSMLTACGSSRLYRFYFDGATIPNFTFGPHHVVLNLGYLAVGQSTTQDIFYGIQQSTCGRLYYSNAYAPSNNALITRLADTTSANGLVAPRWLVQSQGTHRAMCINLGNGGKLINTGVSHFAPFSYTVTEVPYPYPTYP
jgi:hypothetical protein